MTPCDRCGGTLHVRVPHPRVRDLVRFCECAYAMLSRTYVSPLLRQGETTPPDRADTFPLTDVVVVAPEPTAFRRKAWATLLRHYEEHNRPLLYECFESARLPRLHFREDPLTRDKYDTLRELQERPLLILLGGSGEYPSEFLGTLFLETLKVRRALALPTWVYMPSLSLLQRAYGREAVALLGLAPLPADRVLEAPRAARGAIPEQVPDHPETRAEARARVPLNQDPTSSVYHRA